MTLTTEVSPFVVDLPQTDLDDLRDRLARTRFAPPAPDDSWEYGTPDSYLRHMVDRWREFDWREVEKRLNGYPNFTTEIDGQRLHFLHVRSKNEDATPLLLAHSYPGSVLDFLEMIDPLADSFHLVVPSVPGFGFSTPLVGRWTIERVASTYDTLMRALGYPSYGVHGSDCGAMVGRALAVLDPGGFLGAHVLQLFSFPTGTPGEMDGFGAKEYAALQHLQWFQSVGGYNQMNATRPQTVGSALADSPVAVLAYSELFENFGNGTSLVAPEQVLAQATLYWLTNTYATAARYHYEQQRQAPEPVVSQGRLGVAVFKDDFQSIRQFAERDNANIQHWSEFPRGGHYASMEVPQDLVADLRVFFRENNSVDAR